MKTTELTWSRLVRMRLSVHCLATSFASRVTSSEALAMSLAHWMRARLFPLPPRTRRDISAMSKAIRFAAPMMSFPYEVREEHNQSESIRFQRSITVLKVFTYFAGPFAGFIVELPGSHHHGLVHHITSLLLRELLIFLLWGWRPGRRNLTLRKGRFGWCCLIIKLQGQVKLIVIWQPFWTSSFR